ncbi:hypothetical protein O4J55_11765 [Paracoccus sp. PXZ]
MLKEGYGVEDISLKTGRPLDEVRFAVALLRESGSLDILLHRKPKPLPDTAAMDI